MKDKRRLIEGTPSIHIREVRKAGVLPGMETVSIRAGTHFNEGARLIWRETSFGGQRDGKRAYFECSHCFRGTETLYAAPYLACRKCHGLAYRVENLTPLWRKREKLRKLQLRGATDDLQKPKWMRWHTFLNLRRKIEAADHDFAAAYVRSRHGSGLFRSRGV
jgi:hypothetical protein